MINLVESAKVNNTPEEQEYVEKIAKNLVDLYDKDSEKADAAFEAGDYKAWNKFDDKYEVLHLLIVQYTKRTTKAMLDVLKHIRYADAKKLEDKYLKQQSINETYYDFDEISSDDIRLETRNDRLKHRLKKIADERIKISNKLTGTESDLIFIDKLEDLEFEENLIKNRLNQAKLNDEE